VLLVALVVEEIPVGPSFHVSYEQTEVCEMWVLADDEAEVRALFASGDIWLQNNADELIETTGHDQIINIERLAADHPFSIGD
jgi:hypothetical protein